MPTNVIDAITQKRKRSIKIWFCLGVLPDSSACRNQKPIYGSMHRSMNESMHGSMLWSMHGSMLWSMHGSMHASMHGSMLGSMHGSMHPCMHECIHAWIHAWIDESMYASMHVSDMIWPCSRHDLGIIQTSFGYHSDIIWASSRHGFTHLDMFGMIRLRLFEYLF